jgi:hypothetical protein
MPFRGRQERHIVSAIYTEARLCGDSHGVQGLSKEDRASMRASRLATHLAHSVMREAAPLPCAERGCPELHLRAALQSISKRRTRRPVTSNEIGALRRHRSVRNIAGCQLRQAAFKSGRSTRMARAMLGHWRKRPRYVSSTGHAAISTPALSHQFSTASR